MYKIIGADQKEYGPISADQIRQWISEGRVNGKTQVCAEGTQEWKPLEMFPEFGFTATPAPTAPPAPETVALRSPQEVLAGDYSLDIMSCLSRAGALFKDNVGSIFVTFLLCAALSLAAFFVVGLILAAAGINHLPMVKQLYFRPINAIFGALVLGPALGGAYHVYLSILRGRFASAGDLFTGFKSFQDLFLSRLIFSLVNTACMFPYMLGMAAKIGPYFDHLQQNPASVNPQEMIRVLMSGYLAPWPYLLMGMVISMYFWVNWIFVTPLIVDQKMGFWTAMVTSWKIVHKHWFQIFGLLVLLSLINVAGFFVCCIGVLVTVPFGMLAICYAYEDIFRRKNA